MAMSNYKTLVRQVMADCALNSQVQTDVELILQSFINNPPRNKRQAMQQARSAMGLEGWLGWLAWMGIRWLAGRVIDWYFNRNETKQRIYINNGNN
jgi:hypothetical protein